MNCYRIKDWDLLFEVSQSRRAERAERLRWVAIPNKHDGKGYRRLIRQNRGMEMYGAWQIIVQVASRCPLRGTLGDQDGPLTADDIADKTGFCADVIENTLKACCSKEIGWLEAVNWSDIAPSVLRAYSERALPTVHNKTVHNKTKHDDTPANAGLTETAAGGSVTDSAVLVFSCDGEQKTWELRSSQVSRFGELYPALDIMAEMRAALAWIEANASRRKTAAGMKRFLTGWLGRSQNRGGKSNGKTDSRGGRNNQSIPSGPGQKYDGSPLGPF